MSRKQPARLVPWDEKSRGVGRAIVRAFAEQGARLGLIARNEDGLDAAAREVRERGGEALVLSLDVSDAAAVEDAARTIADIWGGIDIWGNDTMVSIFSPAIETTADEFRRVTNVNYLGYVHGTLAALKRMRSQNRGVIVQIDSALAYRSIPLQSAYCASKAAFAPLQIPCAVSSSKRRARSSSRCSSCRRSTRPNSKWFAIAFPSIHSLYRRSTNPKSSPVLAE